MSTRYCSVPGPFELESASASFAVYPDHYATRPKPLWNLCTLTAHTGAASIQIYLSAAKLRELAAMLMAAADEIDGVNPLEEEPQCQEPLQPAAGAAAASSASGVAP